MNYGLLLSCLAFLVSCGPPKVPATPDNDTGEAPDEVVEPEEEIKEGLVFGNVRIQPESFDFGEIETGSPTADTWTVTNDGEEPVTITTAFVDGTGFTLGTDPTDPNPVELLPDEFITGTILFEPPDVGPFSGKLSIGVSTETAYAEIILRGNGVEPGATDDSGEPTPAGALAVYPESLDFGPFAIGETTWRTIQLTNTGEGPVLITQVASSNSFIFQLEPDFMIPASLSAGQVQTVQVGFSPVEITEYEAMIDIDADIADGGIMVPLSGIGDESGCIVCAPVLSVYTSSGSADTLTLSPPSGMGCTANGGITLTNTGDLPLSLTDVYLNNDEISACGEFSRSWIGELSLAPGESTTVGVDYVAESPCMESSYPESDQNVLHVLSSDPDRPDYTVRLEGDALYCGG